MKTRHFLPILLICILAVTSATLALAQKAGNVIPGRYIVQLKRGAVPERVIKTHGVIPDFVYDSVINGFAGPIAPGQLKTLQADSDVVSIVPDRVMMAIAGGPDVQMGANASVKPSAKPTPVPTPVPEPEPPQVIPAGVQHIGALGGLTGEGVGVAVVDTGLDFKHPDLPINRTSYYTAYKPSAQDNYGHGTHVGGIIAAIDNTIDVVGVAPGATLYAVKVLDSQGNGTDSTILAGLNWINTNAAKVNPPIRVVNMSLGRRGSRADNPTLEQAIKNLHDKGITVVVAAGNDGSIEVTQQVPACYPGVLAVASSTAMDGACANPNDIPINADTASYFTTDGAFNTSTWIGVTISAPGEDQEDTDWAGYVSSVGILSTRLGGGTTRMSGTSMAAPHVSGVVARIYQAYIRPTDSLPAIVETVRNLIWDHAMGRHSIYTDPETNMSIYNPGYLPIASQVAGASDDAEREGIVSAGWLQ